MNRSKLKDKRALRVRLTLLYTFMVMAVLLLVGGLYLVVQGYRFNSYEGRLQQGGLVQFNSFPSGASIWLDGKMIDKKTQNKLTISAGKHKFSMWRDGYNDWNVERVVSPGDVLWLNYTRLVPKDLKVDYPVKLSGLTSSATSLDNKTVAVVEDQVLPTLALLKVGSENPSKTYIALPPTLFTAAAEGTEPVFSVVAWARDNKYVLVEYQHGDKTEWISVNTANVADSKNITTLMGIDALDVQYSYDDANVVYALTPAAEVRRVSLDQKNLSAPIARNIDNFSLYDSNTVAYATKPDEQGVRTIGYATIGAQGTTTVAEFKDSTSPFVTLRINKYFGRNYLVVVDGKHVQILTGDLAASDAKNPAPFTKYAEFTLEADVLWAGFSPDSHRFVYAQSANGVVTYDLDMKAKYALHAPDQPKQIDWIDEFHFTALKDGSLTIYDFDGSNNRALITNATNNSAALMQNGRYLYGLHTAEDESISLARVKMIVD